MSTTENTEDTKQIKFFTSWFCPYAQRVWIALLHKQASFEHVEQNPYDKKNPELLAVNPKAMVPAISLDNRKLIYESSICVEYVDERWRTNEKALLPSDPYERAYVRYWGQYVTKFGVPLYQILKKQGEEREQAKRDIVIHLQAILQEFKGPFFNGTIFGYVDVLIAPFIDRLQMLKHFRDFHPVDNIEDGELERRFWEWDKALRSHPSVSLTIPSLERLIESYKEKYTD